MNRAGASASRVPKRKWNSCCRARTHSHAHKRNSCYFYAKIIYIYCFAEWIVQMVNGEKRHNEVIRVIHSAANDEIEPEIVCRTRRQQQQSTANEWKSWKQISVPGIMIYCGWVSECGHTMHILSRPKHNRQNNIRLIVRSETNRDNMHVNMDINSFFVHYLARQPKINVRIIAHGWLSVRSSVKLEQTMAYMNCAGAYENMCVFVSIGFSGIACASALTLIRLNESKILVIRAQFLMYPICFEICI